MTLPPLHKSTIVFLVLVTIVLLLVNIPGRLVCAPGIRSCRESQYGPDFACGEDSCRHGWPSPFLLREPIQLSTSPLLRLSVWRLSEGITDWSWWALAADILAGAVILVVAGGAFEFWRRRRGHLQLCVTDVLVIVALVACGFSYWATLENERRRQAGVVRELVKSGSLFDENEAEWSVGGPSWLREWLGDQPFAVSDRIASICVTGEGLANLPKLPNLMVVRVDPPLTNQQLDSLRELPKLDALVMSFAMVSHEKKGKHRYRETIADEEPDVRLPPLPHLRGLNLCQASFCGEGLEHLRDIEVLDLTETAISDNAMLKFELMRNLKSLSLAGTDITDIGLEHLKGLGQLRELWLEGTEVTPEGIKRLQRALPNCKIKQ
jgi:hypothetical protein